MRSWSSALASFKLAIFLRLALSARASLDSDRRSLIFPWYSACAACAFPMNPFTWVSSSSVCTTLALSLSIVLLFLLSWRDASDRALVRS